jgi:hypothetical protein
MTKNPPNLPDERLVYLALKNTFKGADAQVRKTKKVRELIQKTQQNIDVRDLIKEHNIDNVCNVAKALLEQQIFESTLVSDIAISCELRSPLPLVVERARWTEPVLVIGKS